jgi:acetyl esterase/lipase
VTFDKFVPEPRIGNIFDAATTASYRDRMQKTRAAHVARQVGALAVAALTAASTLNGYRPLARKGYPSIFSWAFGLVVTEFPLQTLVSQVVGLLLTARRLTRPVRRTAWIVAGLSALGLLNFNRAGHQASAPLTAALDDGLGPHRRTNSDGLWRRPAGDGTAKTPGALRMLRIYRDYAHDGDISYGEYGGANYLDIWRRPDLDRNSKAPVLFQIPGGAWTTGNKRGQAHPLMSHLAELGWVCVAINYRHSPRNTWPDHIVDVKRALAWVKAHIAEYGGDPDFVAITGGSAGGHLSSLAALTPNNPRFQPGFEDADTRVQAAVPFYGVYDFTRFEDAMHPSMPELLEQMVVKQRLSTNRQPYVDASPVIYVSADAPPFFVLHGRNDSLVPVEQGRGFVERLREVSTQPVVYTELPFTQHAFDIFGSARAAHAAVAVEQFLAEIYARRALDSVAV